jgi:hypothetical protein
MCVGRGYGRAVLIVGSIASQFAGALGLIAAAIAVFGFLGHAKPALARADDADLRFATVVGGLAGLIVSFFVMVLSELIG